MKNKNSFRIFGLVLLSCFLGKTVRGTVIVTSLQECVYDTSEGTKCKVSGVAVGQGEHCILANKSEIYLSSGEDGTCAVVNHEPILVKNADMKAGVFGTDNGLIYTYSGSAFSQIISNPYFHDGDGDNKYIYDCAATGICTKTVSNYYLLPSGDKKYLYKCGADGKCATVPSVYYLKEDGTPANNVLYLTENDGEAKAVTATIAGVYLAGIGSADENPKYDYVVKCTGTTASTCEMVATSSVLAGYYYNSGSNKAAKPIIACDGTNCVAIEVTNDMCGVGEQNAGGLILTDGKIYICLDGYGTSMELRTDATNAYYHTMTVRASVFPGQADGGTINIKVNKNGSVTILDDDTTALSTDNCIGDNNCATGKYYKITSNKICKASLSNACGDISYTDVGLAGAGTGYIYFKSDTEKVDISTAGVVVNMVYECTFSGDGGATFNGCEQIKQGTIYDPIKQKVVTCNGWKGEGCTVTTAPSSCSNDDEGKIIVSGGNKSICFGRNTIALPATATKIVFRTKITNTIYGLSSDENVVLSISANKAVVDTETVANGEYRINANGLGGKKNALIYCTSGDLDDCEIQNALSGYYLNSGADKATKQIIKCTNAGCTEIAKETSAECGKVGELKYITTKVLETEIGISLCLTNSGSTANTNLIQITSSTDKSYKTMTVEANTFPDASGKITLKFEKSKVVLMEEAALPECPSTIPTTGTCLSGDYEGQHCIHKATKKIYRTTQGKCQLVPGSGPTENLFFSSNYYWLVDDATDVEAIAYHCTFTRDGTSYIQDSCVIAKGYLITKTKTINCNGWKGEKCIVTPITSVTCSTVADNAICGSSNKLKLSSNADGYSLPTEGSKIIALELAESSGIYGKSKGILFLSLYPDRAIVTTVDNVENKYYYNQNYDDSNAPTSKPLIKYNRTQQEWETADFNDTTKKSKYFAYVDEGDPNKKTIVVNDDGTTGNYIASDLTGRLNSNNLYYLIDDTNPKKVLKCTKKEGCAFIDSGATATVNTYFVDHLTTDKIIKCDNTKCSAENHSGTDAAPTYYVDGGVRGNIIKCEDTSDCTSYIGSSAPGHAYVDKDVSDGKNIITCNDGVCVSTNKSSAFASTNLYFIDGGNPSKLITCDKNETTKCYSVVTTSGYYVDGIDSSKIITCTNNECLSTTFLTLCSSAPSASTSCKYKPSSSGTETTLTQNNYCIYSDKKIYLSKETPQSCSAINPASDSEVFLFKLNSNNLYEMAEAGKDNSVLIYECSSTSCTQYFSTHYLYEKEDLKYLYRCDHKGVCLNINEPSVGYYLAGTPTIENDFSLSFTKLIKCADKKSSECELISDLSSSAGYYVDNIYKSNVIKCSTSKCFTMVGSTNPAVGYIDVGKKQTLFNEDSTPVEKDVYRYVINCQNGICVSEDKCTGLSSANGKKLYFSDGDNIKKVITCGYSDTDYIVTCTSSAGYTGSLQYYIDGFTSDYTIKCAVSASNDCSITEDCRVDTGDYCKDKTYYQVVRGTDTTGQYLIQETPETASLLYYCTKNSNDKIECKHIKEIGYYVNQDEKTAFMCSKASDIDPVLCESATIGTACSDDADLGGLFFDQNNNIALCVNNSPSSSTVILSPISQLYILQYKSGCKDPFALGSASSFALININENSVVLAKDYNYENDYYVYGNTDSYKVLVNGVCPYRTKNSLFSTSIKEYKCGEDKPAICE